MIYVTGDTHGSYDMHKLNAKNFPEQRALTKPDYVIVLGDFGLVWNNSDEEMYWRKWLDEKPFTTLFLDGNHDNHDLISSYPETEMFGSSVHQISDSIFHLKRGEVYTIEGLRLLTIGGADSIDKAYRVEGKDWWMTERITESDIATAIRNVYDKTTGTTNTFKASDNYHGYDMEGLNFKDRMEMVLSAALKKAKISDTVEMVVTSW